MKCRHLRTTRSLALCLVAIYVVMQLFVFLSIYTPELDDLSRVSQPWFASRDAIQPETPIDLDEEIRRNLEYVRSIKDTKRKLIFVHIPKTAGTTIEEVGALQANSAWGSCLFRHRPKRRITKNRVLCKYPPGQFEWPMNIGYWHLPTQMFPLMGTNPYEGADLFAVVRDPEDRLLSEFYYICRRKVTIRWDGSTCNSTRVHEPNYMNGWLQQKLSHIPAKELSHTDYLHENGHFTPQYEFIVSSGDIRMVDYVLNMDQLQSEFPALMKAYGISASLPVKKQNSARNATDLEATHFDETTGTLLHKTYGRDFMLMPRTSK